MNLGQLALRSAWAHPACTGHLQWAVSTLELEIRQVHVGVFPVHLSGGPAGASGNVPRPELINPSSCGTIWDLTHSSRN